MTDSTNGMQPPQPAPHQRSRAATVPPELFGRGDRLPGFGDLMPGPEKRRTTRHHYRWECYALNRESLERELPLWRENARENRPFWERSLPLAGALKGKHMRRNKVCAVCGSGPSLGYELPDLARLRDRLVVVAVDSAVHPLKLCGIRPDVIFVRNGDAGTADLLHRYPTKESLFVLPVGAHPDLVRMIEGRILFYVPLDEQPELAEWAAGFPASLPRLVLKPWTGVMAFHFSRQLGCVTTTLEGMDFAYSYGKYWCDAVRYLDRPDLMAELDPPAHEDLAPIVKSDIFSETTYSNTRLHLGAEELFRAVRYGMMEDVYNASLGLLLNLNWLPVKYAVELLPDIGKKLPKGSQIWQSLEIAYPKGSNSREVNQVTTNAYVGLMSRNMIVNHEAGLVKRKLSELFEEAKSYAPGRVAVVAGAGPSLDDTLEALKRHRDRYFLLAVDASLHPLLTAGLRPDATISIDPERRVGLFFDGVDTRGLNLIAGLTTHPEVAAMWQGDILWSFMVSPLPHLCHLIALYDKVSLALPYGNCGTTGIGLCLALGFKSVVYTGIDFAYTHDRAYCRNIKIERELRPEDREGLETMLQAANNARHAIDVRGNAVMTDTKMERYANTLVSIFGSLPQFENKLFNAGSGITHGVPLVDLDEFFAAEAAGA